MRAHPSTLTKCWGGLLRQPRHTQGWHEQPHLIALGCCHLRLTQRHHLLPPSYPSPLVTRCVFLQGKGLPIYSVTMGNLPHASGSARNASTLFVTYTNVMALVLLTSRSFFYVGDRTSLALPTNPLPMDGLNRGEGIFLPFHGIHSPPILLLLVLLEALFGRLFSCLKFFFFLSSILLGLIG
jgi:hypothetical protein